MTLILAGSYEQAREYAIQHLHNRWRYVTGYRSLKGVHKATLIRVGTWYMRSDLDRIGEEIVHCERTGRLVIEDIGEGLR